MFFSKLVDDESETTASESRLRDSLSNQETSSKIENDAQVEIGGPEAEGKAETWDSNENNEVQQQQQQHRGSKKRLKGGERYAEMSIGDKNANWGTTAEAPPPQQYPPNQPQGPPGQQYGAYGPPQTTMGKHGRMPRKGALGDAPEMRLCKSCGQTGITNVQYKNGTLVWAAALVMFCFQIIPCWCWAPFCKCSGCKDVEHFCSSCGGRIGTYETMRKVTNCGAKRKSFSLT